MSNTANNITILYEDNHLLVVEKPPNVPVQTDASRDYDLLSMLKGYIKEKYDKPGAVYLGLVHRLDRPVGGVMVFARTSKAASRLSEQFKSGAVGKRYAAVVEGEAEQGALLRDYISDSADLRVIVSPTPLEGAKRAVLRYHRIAASSKTSLLDIELLTGRKHQIRAQLLAHGLPIAFDQRYNDNPGKGQIALWAYALTLTHPTTREVLTFCSIPKNKAFSSYESSIRALRAFSRGYVVYADEELLVADKREGVEVTTADGGKDSLQAALEACFSTLYPVHRIDANTRGLVLLARTQRAEAELEEMFSTGGIEKIYRCVVKGVPRPSKAILTAHAKKDAERGELYVRGEAFPGSSCIKTGYGLIESRGDCSLLEVRLYTGKTHQIRAHMAYLGHPILGDDKYGDYEWNKRMRRKKQALVAYSLAFLWHGRKLRFISGFTPQGYGAYTEQEGGL